MYMLRERVSYHICNVDKSHFDQCLASRYIAIVVSEYKILVVRRDNTFYEVSERPWFCPLSKVP